jgi:hypothetical protein
MSQDNLCLPTDGVFTNDPAHPQGPGPFLSPICYTIPPAEDVLNAFLSTTLNPDGSVNTQTIVDGTNTPIPGAVAADCPTASSGGGSTGPALISIQDEGVPLGQFSCLNFTGAGVTASVGGCGVTINIPGGGGGGFPLLAPDGTCAAPSYSFTSDPDSGLFRNTAGGEVTLSSNACNDFVRVGGVTSGVVLESATALALNFAGELSINGTPGAAGEVLTSNGPGVAPTWQAASGGSPVLYAENPVAHVAPSASGNNSVAIGSGANSVGNDAMVFGTGAIAASGGGGTTPGIAIGLNALAGGPEGNSIAIGTNVQVSTGATIAIGHTINISAANAGVNDGSIVIGQGASATSNDNIVIGFSASALNNQGVAIGALSGASALRSVAIGTAATAGAANAISVGFGASTGSVDAIAIGNGSAGNALRAIGIGPGAVGAATDAIAIGTGTLSVNANAVAIGTGVTTTATQVAIGTSDTNKFLLSSTGALSVVGTAAMLMGPIYTVGTLPAQAAGGIIYVSNATPAAALCFSNGTNWIDLLTGAPVV